jgi:nucleoid DNA-binding protein
MANPMSKSKIIAYMTEKVSTDEKPVSKKQVVAFFDELFKLAVKETRGAGKFVIPGIGRAVKAHRKARAKRSRSRPRPWCACAQQKPLKTPPSSRSIRRRDLRQKPSSMPGLNMDRRLGGFVFLA